MKSYSDLENRMKTLANEHLPTPPAAAWGNIEGALDEGKGRQGLWFFMFMGLILIGVASFAYMGSKSASVLNTSQMSKEASNTESDVSTKQTANVVYNSNENIQANTVETDETAYETNANAISSNTKLNITRTPAFTQKNKAITKNLSKANKPSSSLKKSNANTSNVVNTSNNATQSFTNSTSSVSSYLPADDEKNMQIPTKNARNVLNIDEIPFVSPILDINTDKVEYNKEVECPSFKNKSFKIYPFAEVNGILGAPNKAMSTSTTPALLAQRNLTETNWYTWGGNAGVGLNITSWLYAGVGLEWNQSKDKFESSKNAITQVVIDYDPTTNLPIDTSFLTGLLVNKGEVRYTTVDLPVYIGVSKSFGNWGVGFEGGILMNLAFNAEGKIINESLDISRINQEAPIYKDRLGMGMRASLNIRRYLNNGLSLQVKPTFKSYFNELQMDNYAINTKLSMVRLDVGIRKDF